MSETGENFKRENKIYAMQGSGCDIRNRTYFMSRIISGRRTRRVKGLICLRHIGTLVRVASVTRDMDKNEQTVVVQRVFDSTGKFCETLGPEKFLDFHGRYLVRDIAMKSFILDQKFSDITN